MFGAAVVRCLAQTAGHSPDQHRWCLSQVKGAVDDDVAEGKTQ
uniref:Uncharacterized protein n=1 Tax=Sinocyclocheilus grahami TaxID=75366 RepID=A0A672KDP3_SINGR